MTITSCKTTMMKAVVSFHLQCFFKLHAELLPFDLHYILLVRGDHCVYDCVLCP